jgi:hypothetical protein
MAFAGRIRRRFVEFLVWGAQKQLRSVKKMDRTLKQLGIPMPAPAKTPREMLVRSFVVWSVLAIVFTALYWALSRSLPR